MFGLGTGEIILILAVLTLVFGATRLPAVGEGIGKAIRNLKRGLAGDDDIRVSTDKQVTTAASTEKVPADLQDAEIVEK